MLTAIGFFFSRIVCMFLRVSGGNNFPPPLSAKEEKYYFALARQGDLSARNTLIEHNLRLVAHIVKKYYSSYPDQDDLVSIGTIGLIKAIDTFDTSNGARFATYAGKCLQNEILMYFRSRKKLAGEVSIEEPVDVDKDGNPLTYMDIISTDEDMVDEIETRIRSSAAYKAINKVLTPRERTIILLRYGLTEQGRVYAQREVAEKMGISRSYVSRLENGALEKLCEYMTKHRI